MLHLVLFRTRDEEPTRSLAVMLTRAFCPPRSTPVTEGPAMVHATAGLFFCPGVMTPAMMKKPPRPECRFAHSTD